MIQLTVAPPPPQEHPPQLPILHNLDLPTSWIGSALANMHCSPSRPMILAPPCMVHTQPHQPIRHNSAPHLPTGLPQRPTSPIPPLYHSLLTNHRQLLDYPNLRRRTSLVDPSGHKTWPLRAAIMSKSYKRYRQAASAPEFILNFKR